jgi:large subunit ribosomal protein L4
MPSAPILDINGQEVGSIELSDKVFATEVNVGLMHQAVVRYLANQRTGTHQTKNRAAVSGGGKKPWRQKGTGRARAGSTRSPIWKGGGVVFGPVTRDHGLRMPVKMRRAAVRSAFSSKFANGEITILDSLSFEAPKTKQMMSILENLKIDRRAIILLPEQDANVIKSANNIPGIETILATEINTYQLLLHDRVVILKDAVSKVEEVLV